MRRYYWCAGDLKAASKAYQELVQQFPGYIDCYLRLSALARAAGDMDKAKEWADAATQQAGGDVDAQSLLATLYLQRGCGSGLWLLLHWQSLQNCVVHTQTKCSTGLFGCCLMKDAFNSSCY
jgi:tetratricopeptide (TPR) repeat protein